jgi:folate-binding protein YgfZ
MKFPTHTAVYWWNPAAWLRINGSDAANFLQGQFTNDLRAPSAKAGVYGLWLNVKGKVVADSFVVPGAAADEFWVGSYFSMATAIRERLEGFVIADDVVIEEVTGAWSAVTIVGDGSWATLTEEPREGVVFRGRRGRTESAEWIFPASHREVVRAQLAGLVELSTDEMARRRIEAGIPAVPADLGLGDLPVEGGLEADAISYTKGCYLGQEVMARLKSMGQVRRRLVRVAFAGEKSPALPAPLFLAARQVGELRSFAPDGAGGLVGLAMVSLLHVAPGAQLAFAPDSPTTITVIGAR